MRRYKENKAIASAIKRLNKIEVTTAYPFLLNIYDMYDKERLSAKEVVDVLQIIENYMIRRFVCGIPTNTLNKIFPPLYKEIISESNDDFLSELRNVLKRKKYPTNYQFRDSIEDMQLYGGGSRQLKTRLILESIEKHYGHKEEVSFDKASIEHVMPQKLTDDWKKILGEDWERDHELFLHTMGNLTLTAYNPELSNSKYSLKKEMLAKSNFQINKYFSTITTWNKEEILKRAKVLADIAIKIWPYFGGDIEEQISEDNVTGTSPVRLIILGQEMQVHSWRDVLEKSLDTIAEWEPDKFDILLENYPKMINTNASELRDYRKLKNGVYVEVNLAAKDIFRFCKQAVNFVELTDEWEVKIIRN